MKNSTLTKTKPTINSAILIVFIAIIMVLITTGLVMPKTNTSTNTNTNTSTNTNPYSVTINSSDLFLIGVTYLLIPDTSTITDTINSNLNSRDVYLESENILVYTLRPEHYTYYSTGIIMNDTDSFLLTLDDRETYYNSNFKIYLSEESASVTIDDEDLETMTFDVYDTNLGLVVGFLHQVEINSDLYEFEYLD